MIQLSNLVKLKKRKKEVGRGGKRGGTSTRGHKGQNARSGGGVRIGFRGGQTSYRGFPKRGFNNKRFARCLETVSVNQFNRFEESTLINRELLIESGLIKEKKGKRSVLVKVLGNEKSNLEKKLTVVADQFSASAVRAITRAGGSVRYVSEEG